MGKMAVTNRLKTTKKVKKDLSLPRLTKLKHKRAGGIEHASHEHAHAEHAVGHDHDDHHDHDDEVRPHDQEQDSVDGSDGLPPELIDDPDDPDMDDPADFYRQTVIATIDIIDDMARVMADPNLTIDDFTRFVDRFASLTAIIERDF